MMIGEHSYFCDQEDVQVTNLLRMQNTIRILDQLQLEEVQKENKKSLQIHVEEKKLFENCKDQDLLTNDFAYRLIQELNQLKDSIVWFKVTVPADF